MKTANRCMISLEGVTVDGLAMTVDGLVSDFSSKVVKLLICPIAEIEARDKVTELLSSKGGETLSKIPFFLYTHSYEEKGKNEKVSPFHHLLVQIVGTLITSGWP